MKPLDLLRIENMNPTVKWCKSSIFSLEVHQIVSVNRSRFKTDKNRVK